MCVCGVSGCSVVCDSKCNVCLSLLCLCCGVSECSVWCVYLKYLYGVSVVCVSESGVYECSKWCVCVVCVCLRVVCL